MSGLVIGLTGKKRSGKGEFARRLVEEHGFTQVSLAGPLKDAALELDPVIGVEFSGRGSDFDAIRLSEIVDTLGWEQAKEIREVRRTLQHMGVGVRNLDEDFWLRIALERIGDTPGPVVVDDVRFPNEADAVQLLGHLVRIVRPGLESDDTHDSETALDDWPVNFTIHNSRDLEWLHLNADAIARALLKAQRELIK
ncbi:hypothetical protein CLV30_10695 [Haloactinopolyspora alba]|uniref:Dephospho-CoA kinase n=1 Tax=Haloactinopolyspora alba TaxID=648780 RepID=A0A2P8E3P3_9ACTN|nr:hypothetical protein [Haloactinopolyspora alba]PSL04092.1 hypothetical protein CLV30_10695 [Haloactinopolyspora alba]